MSRAEIMLALILLLACKPKFVLDPVYDCTTLTKTQQEDMAALIDKCESWECEQRAMQLYCEEMPPHESNLPQ